VDPEVFFEDFTVGREFDLGAVTVDGNEMLEFSRRYDPQWYHVDPERAAASPWGGLIASGWFTASLCMRLYVDNLISRAAADTSPGLDELRWLAPVRAGDTLHATVTVEDAQPSSRSAELGTVTLRWLVTRDGTPVLRMRGRGWFRRRRDLRNDPAVSSLALDG
jgi:acyl dehydratase